MIDVRGAGLGGHGKFEKFPHKLAVSRCRRSVASEDRSPPRVNKTSSDERS